MTKKKAAAGTTAAPASQGLAKDWFDAVKDLSKLVFTKEWHVSSETDHLFVLPKGEKKPVIGSAFKYKQDVTGYKKGDIVFSDTANNPIDAQAFYMFKVDPFAKPAVNDNAAVKQ